MNKLKILDLFSGIGGFSVGLERTGYYETVAFCEIDKYCKLLLQKHWKGVKIYDDVKKITKEELKADGIPSLDMIRIKRYMRRYTKSSKMTLVGPNCAGIISPGKSMLGIMPGHIYMQGTVGVIGRSGTLGYEAAQQMKNLNIGVSTSVGIGGDPINGCSFRDILEKFEQDDQTKAILMIGEIGGPQEVEAGKFAKENMSKPVVAYIAGLTAPKGRVMGHAGAIVSAYGESAVEKVELLKECGVTISKNPSVMGETVKSVLNGKKN